MRASVVGMGIWALAMGLHAQGLDLSARIVQGNGDPVPNATVDLLARGVSSRTASDGSFHLGGNTSLGPGGARPSSYRLNPHFLTVEARLPVEVKLEVFDGVGGLRGSRAWRLGMGRHNLALDEAMPGSEAKAGLFFLRVRLDGNTFTHPFFLPDGKSRGSIFAPAYARVSAAKRAAAVDSLRIRKAGYQDLVVPIASYTAGSLGDLVLSEAPDDGSICARQRSQRTADGFEVILCEELFDRAPRVRLPAKAAGTAFAEMTAEAFVTQAGASYPHAIANSSSPEMVRHASALYDITLLDGKVENFQAAILFADSLFMAPFLGKTFEGRISKRTAANRYEVEPSLPVRVQLEDAPYPGEPRGASGFQIRAALVNLAAPVTATDGTCLPSLSSAGSLAPFDAGSDVLLTVGRHPSMHAFGNNEIVFSLFVNGTAKGSLMSPTWFFTPLDLVKNALTPSGTYTGQGHGAPGSIPNLSLTPVSGGGAACSP